ncbi:MAG: GNAT family N-acetyltransferase [Hyphomicrobiales bacterium]|nr:GNAT family N-acetyltransferase [Hyphomicrobiales bacterium]
MHGTIESGYRVEIRGLDALAAVAPELAALAARAATSNVFYEPAFVAAAAPLFGRDTLAGLVWRRGAAARLIGFFPMTVERRRYGVALPVAVGWVHPFAPLGAPLVDRDCREAAVAAWLDHLAADPAMPKLLLLPYLPADGATAQALERVLSDRQGAACVFARHYRALLVPSGDRRPYLDSALGPKKRKELRRQRKRLAEAGVPATTVASRPDEIAAALADFMALEASGWKGRAGTAAASSIGVRRFVEQAVAALAAEGKAQVARLAVGGRTIAATVLLRSGDTAWCWKIAYDEAFARASPGVQVLLDVTENLLADRSLSRADSCATPGHPMIDRVWRERLLLEDRLIGLDPARSRQFVIACRLERLRRHGIAAAKWLRRRLHSR